MFFSVNFGAGCSYETTLTVSGNGSFFFDYFNSYLYVTDQGASNNSVFKIYDMSNPDGPVLRSTTSLPNGSGAVHPRGHILAGHGRICLIPYRTSKVLAIWDVNNPVSPSLLGSVSVSHSPNSVAAIGDVACVGFNENFLQAVSAEKIDISDPTSPTVVDDWSASKLVIEVRPGSAHFWLAGQNSSGGVGHLTSLNASTFAANTATDGLGSAGTGTGALKLNDAFTRAYSINCSNAAITSWDISTPTAPSLIQAAMILGGTPTSACIAVNEDTDRAYVGRGGGTNLEIDIIDISNPASMTLAGDINTSGETVTDISILTDSCAGLAWAQGTGAAIHLDGTPPLS